MIRAKTYDKSLAKYKKKQRQKRPYTKIKEIVEKVDSKEMSDLKYIIDNAVKLTALPIVSVKWVEDKLKENRND